MAFAERAELVARLSLKDDFSGKVKGIQSSLGGLERRFGGIGATAAQGFSTAVGNIAKIGAVAAGGIAIAVKTGIRDLAELENATTSVTGAIEQMGFKGQLTADQVATWANEIEKDVHAAFDDKAITQAATTLLRFGKITPANLKPALVVMTDLATKTGSVDSAATLLARAMADPEKAAGKLARSGVILTKQQQAQIKALVKAGKTTEAQALLLDLLSKATKGAADASQGPYAKAMSVLGDVSEDARKALAIGFLPVLERVADILSEKLADPKVISDIKDFGRGLADAFDKLLTLGTRLPWGQIGDSLKIAGAGAKAVFDAFTGLPPWIQTAVLTGWGLNKLTGGAVFKIGIDLVKGGLGHFLDRGASPANPMWVATAGGFGGGGGGVVGGGKGFFGRAAGGLGAALGGGAALGAAAIAASGAGLVALLAGVQKLIVEPDLQRQAGQNIGAVQGVIGSGNVVAMISALDGIRTGVDHLDPIQRALYELNADGVKAHTEGLEAALVSAIEKAQKESTKNLQPLPDNITKKQKKQFDDVRTSAEQNRIALVNRVNATTTAVNTMPPTFRGQTDRIVTALENLDLRVTVNNTNSVTVNDVNRAQRTTSTYSASQVGALGKMGRIPA